MMKPTSNDEVKRIFVIEVGYEGKVKREWKDVAWSFIYRFEEKLRDMIEDIEVMDDIIQDVNDEFNLKLENPSDIGSEFYIKLTEVKPNDTNRIIISLILKERINKLLKEIEKKQEQIEKSKVIDIHTKSSFKASLDWCKDLIKKLSRVW